MKSIKIIADTSEVGVISIQDGKLLFEIEDEIIKQQVIKIAEKPLFYLKDEEIEGGVKTVKAFADPGTEEHLRVLLFELRKINLEGRINNQGA